MKKEEFEIYFFEFRDRIIKDAMRSLRLTETVAKKIVEKDFRDIDSDGFKTKNTYWFTLVSDESKNIGSLWFTIRGEREQQTPYLTDLYIAPDFRNKGFGKQALALLEIELKSRGIKNNIAVHIIGELNQNAIRLFRSSGYFVTSILMEKSIST